MDYDDRFAKSQFFIRIQCKGKEYGRIAASLALNGMNFHKTKIAAKAAAQHKAAKEPSLNSAVVKQPSSLYSAIDYIF